MADTSNGVTGRVFTRASSGLVRQVGTLDTLYYSLLQAAPQFIFLMLAVWVLYPGSSMELATVVAVVGSALVGVVYGLYASVYPRSGGEYVFISRTVHPAIGFLVSFLFTFWMAWSVGTNAAIVSIFALAPTFVALGFQLGNPMLTDIGANLGQPWGIFLVGLVTEMFFWYVLVRGMKTYFTLQRWFFIAAYASIAVTVLVLIGGVTGILHFQTNFDALVGSGAYNKVISDGQAAGAVLNSRFDLGSTLNFVVWPAESVLFAFTAVAFAGEVRNARRGPLIGIVGGVIAAGAILFVLAFLSRLAFGESFIKAASFIGKDFPAPNAYFPLLASILGGNGVLTLLINIWFVILSFFLSGACAIYASRAIFAWSIDGMAPEVLGRVSDRHHSPTWAIAVSVIGGFITLVLFSFTTLLTILSALISQSFVFLVVCLAGIVFPYKYRSMYKASAARMELFGVPVMTLAGIGGAIYVSWILFRAITDNTAAVNTPFTFYLTAASFVIAIAWFYIARWWRKRQGVDVDLRFREIPIE